MLVPAALFLLSKDDGSRIVNRDQRPPTIKTELQALRRSKTFRFTVLGYAGYAASVIGFSTFGPSIVVGCVEINHHFSAMTWPRWLRRAVRSRHRHAVEQVSRRWRGGVD